MSVGRRLSEIEERILRKAAAELPLSGLVNLGIGLPTHIPQFLPRESDVLFHSENGFVGMGPRREGGTPDDDVIDAGGMACSIVTGAAFFDSVVSFAIVRGGRLDCAVLGAFEVGIQGDLANWKIPGKLTPGMGGAMELAQKARRVLVVSRHADKKGRAKLRARCTLPLTATSCVDTLVTERAVFRLVDGSMHLAAVHPDHTPESALEGIDAEIHALNRLEPWS